MLLVWPRRLGNPPSKATVGLTRLEFSNPLNLHAGVEVLDDVALKMARNVPGFKIKMRLGERARRAGGK